MTESPPVSNSVCNLMAPEEATRRGEAVLKRDGGSGALENKIEGDKEWSIGFSRCWATSEQHFMLPWQGSIRN